MSIVDDYGNARLSFSRTTIPPIVEAHRPIEAATAEKLWDALFLARARKSARNMADMEDAVFRFYLPMARTMAHEAVAESADPTAVEQAAELGLAQAVLAWRQRDSGGFRRLARSSIQFQLKAAALSGAVRR